MYIYTYIIFVTITRDANRCTTGGCTPIFAHPIFPHFPPICLFQWRGFCGRTGSSYRWICRMCGARSKGWRLSPKGCSATNASHVLISRATNAAIMGSRGFGLSLHPCPSPPPCSVNACCIKGSTASSGFGFRFLV